MENITENIIGGILTATPLVLLFLKLFATEWITQFTQHLFKSRSKKRTDLILNGIIVSLFIVGILVVLAPYLYNTNTSQEIEVSMPKSKEEVNAELLKYVIDKGVEGFEKRSESLAKKKEKQRQEDSLYNANRPQRWVYKIGDWVDNDESIFELYKKLNKTDDICLFKDKNRFFLFKNEECTEEQLDDSLDGFKTKMGISAIIGKVDLMTYCNNSFEKIKQTESRKFGRRKDRIKIDCYTVDK
ncbi:MAG: hypothetical protein Q7W45_16500 [Bacteroidota bacterium]|nr:hypothetical protein [Bacteroidota bacterium]MDP3145383.1 hypothetical protein [Bacteroidota bacterium]MDP3557599.1 hypothetical protein [Bacteroidota bacterium]